MRQQPLSSPSSFLTETSSTEILRKRGWMDAEKSLTVSFTPIADSHRPLLPTHLKSTCLQKTLANPLCSCELSLLERNVTFPMNLSLRAPLSHYFLYHLNNIDHTLPCMINICIYLYISFIDSLSQSIYSAPEMEGSVLGVSASPTT